MLRYKSTLREGVARNTRRQEGSHGEDVGTSRPGLAFEVLLPDLHEGVLCHVVFGCLGKRVPTGEFTMSIWDSAVVMLSKTDTEPRLLWSSQ